VRPARGSASPLGGENDATDTDMNDLALEGSFGRAEWKFPATCFFR
jgi:hypothetical protein